MAAKSEPGFGPAMRAINERQRAFVLAASELGREPGWMLKAATMAGYAGTYGARKVQAHRLAHDDKVKAAMKEHAFSLMSVNAVPLTAMLLDIAYGHIPSTPSEKLKAASMLFNRIGMPEVTEHKVTVEHTLDNTEALIKLEKFAKVLNLDPVKLLGSIGKAPSEKGEIIDAEYEEVGAEAFDEFAAEEAEEEV